jgi:ABC-type bacteriocin/lantibiotic exporter with double-glycine peptidase domain
VAHIPMADIYQKYYEKRCETKYMNSSLSTLKLSIRAYFSFILLWIALHKTMQEEVAAGS